MTTTPLFGIKIRDGFEDSFSYVGYSLDGVAWTLLCEFTDRYFIYDWAQLAWKSISRDKFIEYQQTYHSVTLTTGAPLNEWAELPMSAHPERVQASHTRIGRRQHKAMVQLTELAEVGLDRFADPIMLAEKLGGIPDGLEIARSNFLENR